MRRNVLLWTAGLLVLCAGIGAFWLIRARDNPSGNATDREGNVTQSAHGGVRGDAPLDPLPLSANRKDAMPNPVAPAEVVKHSESSTIDGTKDSIGSSPTPDSEQEVSSKAVIDSLNPISGGDAAFESKYRNSTPAQRRERRDALVAGLVSCNGDPEDKTDRVRYGELKDELAWLEQHP